MTVYVPDALRERLEPEGHVKIVKLGNFARWPATHTTQLLARNVPLVNIEDLLVLVRVQVVHPVNGKIGQDQLNVRMIELLVLPDLAS